MYQRLAGIIRAQSPCTVRQVFYRATVAGLGSKDEHFYDRVCRYLVYMRERGLISFGDIADNTRWMRKPRTHGSLATMLAEQQTFYRRALWRDQDVYVEVWLEKDALSGVLYDVTSEWDVPLMVTRGYASLSFLHNAAEALRDIHKPSYIYYFGDFDPSGVDIPRHVESKLREYARGADITFKRVAVVEEQIRELDLPTRPTKTSDSRSGKFQGESVEVDAIEPNQLRDMARQAIEAHIDQETLERTEQIEEQERKTLENMVVHLPLPEDSGLDNPFLRPQMEFIREKAPDLFCSVLAGRLHPLGALQQLEERGEKGVRRWYSSSPDTTATSTEQTNHIPTLHDDYTDVFGDDDEAEELLVQQLAAIHEAPKECWADLSHSMITEKWTLKQTKRAVKAVLEGQATNIP